MGGYGTVGALLLAGWTFLEPSVAWVYLAAAAAFEIWLLGRIAAPGGGLRGRRRRGDHQLVAMRTRPETSKRPMTTFWKP